MGFWTGVADWMGIDPEGPWYKNLGAVLSGGFYQADENYPSFGDYASDQARRLFTPLGPAVYGINDVWSDKVSSTMGGSLDAINNLRENDLLDYVGDLFQSDARAALNQATVNDELSELAWQRSEQSADRALERSRELRRTYYGDLMQGLKDAGLNPVLAASGGFGGVSSSAPMGTSTAATSSKADGLNASTLLQAIASIITASGSLMRGLAYLG